MLVINLRKWLTLAVFAYLVWRLLPALPPLAGWLVTRPGALWFIAGLAVGASIAGAFAWNAALAMRRDQLIDRARKDYEQDKRRIV
jgi:hypothetical protein